jgi:hypothetical protein
VETPKPWLCQGDVFSDVPLVVASYENGEVGFTATTGPALLISEDCQIDKRTSRAGKPKPANFFQLVPVRALSRNQLGSDLVRRLLDGDRNPPALVYLDDVGGNEALAVLSESFPLPSAYFELDVEDFTGDPRHDPNDPDPVHVVARRPGLHRVAAMSEAERHLLQEKLAFYWTHAELRDPE